MNGINTRSTTNAGTLPMIEVINKPATDMKNTWGKLNNTNNNTPGTNTTIVNIQILNPMAVDVNLLVI